MTNFIVGPRQCGKTTYLVERIMEWLDTPGDGKCYIFGRKESAAYIIELIGRCESMTVVRWSYTQNIPWGIPIFSREGEVNTKHKIIRDYPSGRKEIQHISNSQTISMKFNPGDLLIYDELIGPYDIQKILDRDYDYITTTEWAQDPNIIADLLELKEYTVKKLEPEPRYSVELTHKEIDTVIDSLSFHIRTPEAARIIEKLRTGKYTKRK